MRTNAPLSAATSTNAPAASEGLRDVVEPWNIIPLREWLIGSAIALLVLGLLAALLFFWWRARQRRRSQPPPLPPPLPAHIRARQQLEDAFQWLDDPDRFCTEVSRILRQYLEERFGWNAPDRTTEEFLREVQDAQELTNDQRLMLTEFLTRCDLVKFAGLDPSESELRDLHQAAVRLVADTVPAPPAPGSTATPPPPRATPVSP